MIPLSYRVIDTFVQKTFYGSILLYLGRRHYWLSDNVVSLCLGLSTVTTFLGIVSILGETTNPIEGVLLAFLFGAYVLFASGFEETFKDDKLLKPLQDYAARLKDW